MPRFAANLSMLFTDLPFPDRFAAAAKAGFMGVEMHFPYHLAAERVGDLVAMNGVTPVLFNTPPGDWEAGERGLAALPGRDSEFRDGLEIALDYADFLECPHLHVMAGVVDEDDWGPALDTYMDNLATAADMARDRGVTILIEPINPVDMPGYFLTRPEDALRVIEDLDRPNLGLQYNVYHAQMERGALTDTLEQALAVIRHVQIAGVPGRNEPDQQGEINWRYIFDLLDAHGYGGWVGCAYHPRAGTLPGLRWARDWGIGG
ncbi:2-oxo-tetronate isomerase [Roseospira visakhapatnamensis]|uniref:Hydroxypyruvate isomerase n=1 Tax=Roseospira visakhapatnamensis TaxID=390880 RepID=A0A7W6RD88_9PROT|nr:2-oxo-tetronate isomerase [Roseospira visakhapatnamensis]MBB4265889.1 hydroxypyruvate isomerase [Roseospira visakhapatnamensis]